MLASGLDTLHLGGVVPPEPAEPAVRSTEQPVHDREQLSVCNEGCAAVCREGQCVRCSTRLLELLSRWRGRVAAGMAARVAVGVAVRACSTVCSSRTRAGGSW